MTARAIVMAASAYERTPEFVALASNQSTSSTTLSLNKPTGTVDGDLMVAVLTLKEPRTVTPPAGWAYAVNNQVSEGPNVFWKIASAEGASYSWTFGSSAGSASGSIVTYRDARFGFSGQLSANATPCAAPEVTIPVRGSLLLAFYCDSSGAAPSFSTPTGMTAVVSDTDSTSPQYALFSEKVWTTGATGTRTSTLASAGYGVLFFLYPSTYTPPSVTYIASASTQNASTGATLAINKPTGTAQGDLMLALLTAGSVAATWTGDTDWTEVADQGARPGLRVAYKVAGASEGGSYTFTASSSSAKLAGSILTYRGAAYDAIGSIASGADPLTVTGPTAASNWAVLLGIGGRDSASISVTTTLTTTRVTDNDGNAPSYVIAEDVVGAGATGTRTFTFGSTNNVAGVLLTIKPT